jgi:hypothetical protein
MQVEGIRRDEICPIGPIPEELASKGKIMVEDEDDNIGHRSQHNLLNYLNTFCIPIIDDLLVG